MENLFKNTLQDLDKTYNELGKMKDQLLSMSLNSMDMLFEGKDPAYKLMDQKSTNETLSTLVYMPGPFLQKAYPLNLRT